MTATEVVLVVLMGFSPGSADEVGFETKEYPQADMQVCMAQMKRLTSTPVGSFRMSSFCVEKAIP